MNRIAFVLPFLVVAALTVAELPSRLSARSAQAQAAVPPPVVGAGVHPLPAVIMDDHYFQSRPCTLPQAKEFFRSFKNNALTDREIEHFWQTCMDHNIPLYTAAAKMETESSVVTNCVGMGDYEWRKSRAFGYGCSITRKDKNGRLYHPYEGYHEQVRWAIHTMRTLYDDYRPGKSYVKCYYGRFKLYPGNAASYAAYQYCPFYGDLDNYGVKNVGNKLFVLIVKKYERRYLGMFNPEALIKVDSKSVAH